MGIELYDQDLVLMPSTAGVVDDPSRTIHDGKKGGAYEFLFYIRNDDPSRYFHNITVAYSANPGIDSGPLGNTGWSLKFSAGQRQPSEAEWDEVTAGATIAIPQIGDVGSPDTSTYQPVWVRAVAPGETQAQLRIGQEITVAWLEDMV